MFLQTANLSRVRKICVFAGVGLLTLAVILFASTVFSAVELASFAISGQSGLRTLAGIAVAGCLLAAIGFFDE